MALSNKFGGLLLTTGNKSEYAVGYATIYGDMCGGYAPLKDLYKTEVFALARWRNTVRRRAVIPQAVIERPPSAELRENQTRPGFAAALRRARRDPAAACRPGAVARRDRRRRLRRRHRGRVLRLVRISEWKRHQAAPGPKVSAARVRSRAALSDQQRLARMSARRQAHTPQRKRA